MSKELVRKVRIVLASPGDVAEERALAVQVVEDLNKRLAEDLGIVLDLVRWETDAHPGFHPEGGQGLIDEGLRITDSEVLVGLFWKHFGTPVADADSGTEHEFRIAYESWQTSRTPQIFIYFCDRAYAPKSTAEHDQHGKVLAFREGYPKHGLWWPYQDPHDFERLLRNHLEAHLRERFGRRGPEGTAGLSLVRGALDLIRENARIAEEAQDCLMATGSRSRDAKYLEVIETALRDRPRLVHFRVLFGPPRRMLLKEHLKRLLQIRDPKDRTWGHKTLHIGLFEDANRQGETFVCLNEKRALVTLPSFTGLGEYDTALVLTGKDEVQGLMSFVRSLYVASKPIETAAAVDSLPVQEAANP